MLTIYPVTVAVYCAKWKQTKHGDHAARLLFVTACLAR